MVLARDGGGRSPSTTSRTGPATTWAIVPTEARSTWRSIATASSRWSTSSASRTCSRAWCPRRSTHRRDDALKAQAIAARGQPAGQVGRASLGRSLPCCVLTSTARSTLARPVSTSGRTRPSSGRSAAVLMRPNETQLVDTVYSANCGGHTEDNDLVWPARPIPSCGRPPIPGWRSSRPTSPRASPTPTSGAWIHDAHDTFSKPRSSGVASAYRWTTTLDPTSVGGTSARQVAAEGDGVAGEEGIVGGQVQPGGLDQKPVQADHLQPCGAGAVAGRPGPGPR